MDVIYKCSVALLMVSLQTCSVLSHTIPCPLESITFEAFFPCTSVENLKSVEECDIFSYTAAILAVEKINNDSNILPDSTLRLIPIPTDKIMQTSDMDSALYSLVIEVFNGNVQGVVGPSDPGLVELISPFNSEQYLDLLEVSFGATDISFNPFTENHNFYRNLPSDLFLHYAKFALLARFNWYRVGVLSSAEKFHVKSTESLILELQNTGVELAFSGFFEKFSIDMVLEEMARKGLRIVIGIIPSSDARGVLCRARGYGLTTSEHVWILPSYYNPNWWKLDDTELESLPEVEKCSNKEMVDILNSALFVDPVKFPIHQSTELSISEFHDRLIAKTKELFPSLSDTDLTPFLLHSRASRAYEAVWLMAQAWNDITTSASCSQNTELLQYHLEVSLICELCSIYSLCSESKDEVFSDACIGCIEDITDGPSNDNGNEGDNPTLVVDNFYGQILVSQFIDGTHCPIGFYWPATLKEPEFVKLTELVNGHHCLQRLQLDTFSVNTSHSCHTDFWWKGGSGPPSGMVPVTYSNIGIATLVVVSLLITCAYVYATTLLVAIVIWRENKYIKASDLKLSILMIVSVMILLPTPLFAGLVSSALEYNISSTDADILCQCQQWLPEVTAVVFFGALLMKNWRIYRIFYNRKLKQDVDCWWLSDRALLIMVLLLAVPVLMVLSLWSAVDPLHLKIYNVYTHYQDNYDVTLNSITYCDSENYDRFIWRAITAVYQLAILALLVFLTYQNSQIPSRFREEGEVAQRVLLLTFLAAPASSIAYFTLSEHREKYLELVWTVVVSYVLLPSLILTILFVPKFVQAYKDHIKRTAKQRRDEEGHILNKKYRVIMTDIQQLRKELTEKEERIERLKKGRAKPEDYFCSSLPVEKAKTEVTIFLN